MRLFYSRRAFDSATGRFNNNFAQHSTYVSLGGSDGKVSKGGLLTASDFAKAVKKQAKNGHVVIYVHGFNTKQHVMLERQKLLQDGLHGEGFEAAVIAFDWPSDGVTSISAYKRDRKDAVRSCIPMIRDGVLALKKFDPSLKVHIVAHSMGTYLTMLGLHNTGDAYANGPVIDQIAFVAADADQRSLMKSGWGAKAAVKATEQLTHYYSTEDLVLDFSGAVPNFNTKRSGQHGLLPWPADGFRDVACMDRYWAVTEPRERTSVHSHGWYFADKRVHQDMAQTLMGISHKKVKTRDLLSSGDQRLKP